MSKKCEAMTESKSLGNYQQTLKTPECVTPSKNLVLFGKNHVIEVIIKNNKGQKRTSPVASFSPEQKAEKKRSTTNDDKMPQDWGNILRQQNLLYMTKEQPFKHTEDRKAKKNINAKKQQKSTVKHPMKSEEKHLETYASSIRIPDCAVQCSAIYNSNKLAEFNPIHMSNLIKQLKDSVKKDKRTCEIFTEMEQILQKIPMSFVKSLSKDLKAKVDSSAVPLKESDEKIKAMSYEFILEREKLQSEILKRDEQLKEVDQKCEELALQVNMYTQQLHESIKATHEKNDKISVLTKQIEDDRKIIADLQTDLDKQIELAYQNNIDNKCLKMEIDKLSQLSSYKDTQITNYRNTIKDLQNHIAKQFETLIEIYTKKTNTSSQISLIHGHACSSPNSSFSGSNKSWHDQTLSDISTVQFVPEEHILKEVASVRDFEVSLLSGESSHSIMPDENEVTNDKGTEIHNNIENNTVPYQNVNAKKSLHYSSKKDHNKENDTYKMRKFTRLEEKQNDNTKNLFLNASKVLESIVSTKSTAFDVRKQGDMQNRKPVNVPSPLRDYPHPDWSDSSLSSISTVSNLVPSNNV